MKYLLNLESNRLRIIRADGSDSGVYRCVARNHYEEASSFVQIKVEGKQLFNRKFFIQNFIQVITFIFNFKQVSTFIRTVRTIYFSPIAR